MISLSDDKLRIGEVAERAGLRKSAVRYYEEIGLLPEPDRVSGQRIYDPSILRRLALIDVSPARRAQPRRRPASSPTPAPAPVSGAAAGDRRETSYPR